MELKKHFNLKIAFAVFYFLAFTIYIIYGLQPAEAANSYEVSGNLEIPAINLISDVTTLSLNNNELETPDTIVGSFSEQENKTLLIGHSTTVFQDLDKIQLDDLVKYNGRFYRVYSIKMLPKSQISMSKVLTGKEIDTLVLMTCAGELKNDGDASHRLIIEAAVEE